MNDQDREDMLLIVEAVLENYLSEELTKEAVEKVDEAIMVNWSILKAMRARKEA